MAPTVGSVVHYYPARSFHGVARDDDQPCAAIICHVIDDDTVNLVIFDKIGSVLKMERVTLLHDESVIKNGNYCKWPTT